MKTDWDHLPFSRRLTVRLFVDHSVVDAFTSAGAFATQRAYPSRVESAEIHLSAENPGSRLVAARAWTMGSILTREDR